MLQAQYLLTPYVHIEEKKIATYLLLRICRYLEGGSKMRFHNIGIQTRNCIDTLKFKHTTVSSWEFHALKSCATNNNVLSEAL